MSDKFNDHYEMHVRPSTRKLRRIPKSLQRTNMWDVKISDSMLYQDCLLQVDEVDCVEIIMPADRLKELEDLIAWYEGKERHIKNYTDIIEQYRADERVRIENPIVQKAYDKYKTLLELTRN